MNWKVAAVCVLLLVSASVFFPSSMSWQADVVHFLSLPLPALAGFYLLLYVSKKLVCAGGVLKRGLIYIGEHTLYVFAFHLVAFKLVSAVKVAYCGLPWQQVGCHPVIHEKTSSFDALECRLSQALRALRPLSRDHNVVCGENRRACCPIFRSVYEDAGCENVGRCEIFHTGDQGYSECFQSK